MSAQAKGRILAYIVLAMLLTVVVLGNRQTSHKPVTVSILIPQDKPVLVTVATEPEYDRSEFDCLRTNIYYEARTESTKGMEAVALVTINRTKTKHYPSTICAVVTEWNYNSRGRKVCQFSWYCDGKSDEPNLHNPIERKAWEKATAVAEAAMEGKINDFLGRATHYHATYVHPAFSKAPKRYRFLTQIGEHRFYRDVKLALKSAT